MIFFSTTTLPVPYCTAPYLHRTVRYRTVLGDTIKTPEGDAVHSENMSPLGTRRRGTLVAFLLPWGHSYEGDKKCHA